MDFHPEPRDRIPRPRRAAPLALLFGLLLCSCSALVRPPAAAPPGPEEIGRLEADVARDSGDVDGLVALGAAYRGAGRAADARRALERAIALRPDDPAAVLQLGLTYEDLELYPDAQALYTRYLEVGRSRALKARLRGRIPLLERKALRLAMRDALAREAELSATPDPRYVAVLPFIYDGDNAQYRPLTRAMAELLATDLGQTTRLTVLERVKAQILADELKLGQSGLVDPATAARSGRLLGAGRVVQGMISDSSGGIGLRAEIVDVGSGARTRSVADRDRLEGLFDLEKRLALSIYSAMGVELTARERDRIEQRPTGSLQALLEFGLGLEAEDAGDYGAAAAHYTRAQGLDAGFLPARARAAEARQAVASQPVTTAELNALAVTELQPVLPGVDAIQGLVPAIGGRDPGAEVLGNEGVGRQLLLEIILPRPNR